MYHLRIGRQASDLSTPIEGAFTSSYGVGTSLAWSYNLVYYIRAKFILRSALFLPQNSPKCLCRIKLPCRRTALPRLRSWIGEGQERRIKKGYRVRMEGTPYLLAFTST